MYIYVLTDFMFWKPICTVALYSYQYMYYNVLQDINYWVAEGNLDLFSFCFWQKLPSATNCCHRCQLSAACYVWKQCLGPVSSIWSFNFNLYDTLHSLASLNVATICSLITHIDQRTRECWGDRNNMSLMCQNNFINCIKFILFYYLTITPTYYIVCI